MSDLRCFATLICASVLTCLPAAASNLPTGNGFGFAVVNPGTAAVTGFYAHPYSFVHSEAGKPFGEGVETTNFIKNLTWSTPLSHEASAEYEADSQIVHIRDAGGEGYAFMPFGLMRTVLIVDRESDSAGNANGFFRVEWSHQVKKQHVIRASGLRMQLLQFEGVEESLLLVPLGRKSLEGNAASQPMAGSTAWALMSLDKESDAAQAVNDLVLWVAGQTPRALVKREIEQIEAWRVKPTVHFRGEEERHLWRESEILLRMAQCREPNRPGRFSNGLIVACLPDGSWFTPWVRDMMYAALAFTRMGHRDEARAALLAYFNARPTGVMRAQTAGADYQVSVVRYFGDGSEEPFFTMEGTPNIEFDDWGEVLWLLGEYMRQFNDPTLLAESTYRGRLYASARDYVAKPLLENTEPFEQGRIVCADTSIWEEHQKDKKHFAFSTAAAIKGLKEFATVAGRNGDERTRAEILKQVDLLEKGFAAAFIRDGRLHGTLEEGVKNDIDGALMPILNFGLVSDPAIVQSTIKQMELLKVASGGYRRVRGTYTDPAIYEYWYEQEEFLFVDLSLAELYRRQGRTGEADAMLRRIVEKSAQDHNLIPEMYVAVDCQLFHGALGDPTGALPMAGYGAGAYILHLLEREAIENQG